MEKYCVFCGENTVDGVCPNGHLFKKMCLNCAHMGEKTTDEEGNVLVCENEDNLNAAKEKILGAATSESGGYKIKNISFELEPLPLKKPTAKCKNWVLSDAVLKQMTELFK